MRDIGEILQHIIATNEKINETQTMYIFLVIT